MLQKGSQPSQTRRGTFKIVDQGESWVNPVVGGGALGFSVFSEETPRTLDPPGPQESSGLNPNLRSGSTVAVQLPGACRGPQPGRSGGAAADPPGGVPAAVGPAHPVACC